MGLRAVVAASTLGFVLKHDMEGSQIGGPGDPIRGSRDPDFGSPGVRILGSLTCSTEGSCSRMAKVPKRGSWKCPFRHFLESTFTPSFGIYVILGGPRIGHIGQKGC